MEDILFDLYYKSAHRNEELEMTIEELQTELKYRTNENKTLYKEVSRLKKEIERLHKVFDIKDEERVKLVKENKMLRHALNEVKNNDSNN